MAETKLTRTYLLYQNRTLPIGTLVLFLVWLVLMAITFVWWRPDVKQVPAELQAVLWPQPRPTQTISLVDQHRDAFSEDRLKGHWSFVFFGYTHCPDICPTSMLTLKQVSNLLSDDREPDTPTQFVFVSVDPDRDTPEVLADYISYFDDDFVGATGTKAEIDRVTMQFGAGYAKDSGPQSDRDTYLISHTASYFLVDPRGRIVGAFPPPHDPGTIASQLKEIREFFQPATQ